MIDTVVLLIPIHDVILMDESNEDIPNWDLQAKTEYYKKYIRNPSRRQRNGGKYFPRLTLYERRFGQMPNIKIEFSAPKLIYYNNLQELVDSDFEQVILTLQERLKMMGVHVFKKYLENANVSSIHYSKNILLENGYTSSYIISQLSKIDLRKSFDFARARYINDGQSLCAHTSSHEMVLYDKIADLKKSNKRAIDRDQTTYQTKLFDGVKDSEVLRFEIRLNRKQKLKSVLLKLGHDKEIIFNHLFDEEISKKVVMHYWKTIIKSNNLGLFTIDVSTKDLLQSVYHSRQGMKAKQAIYLTGLVLLAKDANGSRELRSIVESKKNTRSWYRISKDFREVSDAILDNNLRDWVMQVESKLHDYHPLTTLPCKE
jgi:hypothetical protein